MKRLSNSPAAADAQTAVAGYAAGEEKLALLRSGAAGFDAVLELIDGATADLRVLFYTFASDECGEKVRDRLVAAAGRGVSVSLIIDDFGSLETSDAFFTPLRDAKCKFCQFQPRLFQRYLLRNHQKMAIADGTRAIVGSFNVANTHMKADAPDGWRDVGVSIEGPAAKRLAAYYDALQAWVLSRHSRIGRLRDLLEAANEHEGAVRWVYGGPSRGANHYLRQIRQEFRSAKRADLIMAYFAPGLRMLGVVRRLARVGRFRLIAAAKTDVKLSRWAAWHTYRRLLKAGAEIYEYQPKLLHTKLIVVDDVVFIGSGNFDIRSLHVNLEVMLRVEREDFVAAVRAFFEGELRDSKRINLAGLRAKASWYNRLIWRAAYFFMVSVDGFLSRRLAR